MWWARRAEDPIGIGARNLRECLLIQIDHLEQHGVTPAVPVAAAVGMQFALCRSL